METAKEQEVIINSNEPKIIVKASAGSGKTHVATLAIAKYAQEHPKHRIDAITFTRAATQELRDRLAQMGIFSVNVTTIHVWAKTYLELYAALYQFPLRIIRESDIKQILQEIVDKYPKKVTIQPLYDFILNNKRVNISIKLKAIYEALERRYIKYKRSNEYYDFTDYPLYLYNVLKKYDENILETDALFVDELQDIDEEQSHVFERVKAKKKFYIGDAKQMIYGFRGASRQIFDRIEEDGFVTYNLRNNYRSYQEIADYSITLYNAANQRLVYEMTSQISDFTSSDPSEIISTRGKGGKVYIINPFGNYYDENKIECFNGSEIIHKFLLLRPQILCRTNKLVEMIQNNGYYMVSTIHQAKGLEYDNVIVIDTALNTIDDINIAYVAVSRARDNLLVCSIAELLEALNSNKSAFSLI